MKKITEKLAELSTNYPRTSKCIAIGVVSFLTSIPILSTLALSIAAPALTSAAGAFFFYENIKNKTTETRINKTGQTVTGSHLALRRLDNAQTKLDEILVRKIRINEAFNGLAGGPALISEMNSFYQEKLDTVVEKSAPFLEKVAVGSGSSYQFNFDMSRPELQKLAHKREYSEEGWGW